jgi:hypothetical protein
MWGLLSGYINYIKVGLAVGICVGFFTWGYSIGHSGLVEYKARVEAAAKAQEEKIQSIQAQHELINKGISNEYEGKLAALRNYYGGMQLNPSSGSMSGISPTPKGTDAATAYPILARQCAETTIQVSLWQEWATENGLIK